MKKIILLSVLLAGCATGPTMDEIMDSWLGRNVVDLEMQVGMPDQVTESASGKIVYIYNSSRTYTTPTTSKVVDPIGPGLGGPFAPKSKVVHSGGQTLNLTCTMQFFIDPETKIITNYMWKGNDC